MTNSANIPMSEVQVAVEDAGAILTAMAGAKGRGALVGRAINRPVLRP